MREVLERVVQPGHTEEMLATARALVPSWADVERAEVSTVGGGITNLLFLLRSTGRPSLLVRIYGHNTEVVIDREAENRLLADLSQRGFSPVLYGRFSNGRIEGFCEGFRALDPAELAERHLQRLIAPRLRELHGFPPPTPDSRLWSTLRGWMDAARTLDFQGADAERRDALNLDLYAADLARLEADFAQRVLPGASSPGARAAVLPVLGHNDLLAGNVLVDAGQTEVRFIDYEYGATTIAAFDLANHFCEYAGFDSDFATGFPSRTSRERFVAAYLAGGGSPEDVADFTDVVDFFVLPDHLWWGTWAVIQARYSPIDFDFLEYARLRLAGFELHRDGVPIEVPYMLPSS